MWQLWGRCKWMQFTQQVGMHHVSFLSCTHKMLPYRSIFSLLLIFANFCFCLHSSLLAVHLMHINVCPSFWWDQGKDIRGRLFLHFRHFWDSGESRFFGIKEHPSGIDGRIFLLLPKRRVGNRFSSNQQREGGGRSYYFKDSFSKSVVLINGPWIAFIKFRGYSSPLHVV